AGGLVRDGTVIDTLPGPAGLVGQAVLAHEIAARRPFQRLAILRLGELRAGVAARPGPAWLRDRHPVDDAGDRVAVGAGLRVLLATAVGGEGGAAALVAHGRRDAGDRLGKPQLARCGMGEAREPRDRRATLENVEAIAPAP